MVDTGFSALGTGAGLKLKSWRASNIPALGSTRLKVGDGREVDFGFAPAVGIIAIDQHAFPKPIPVPAIFGEGVEALGIMFLLFCVSIFDGPSGFLTIDMP